MVLASAHRKRTGRRPEAAGAIVAAVVAGVAAAAFSLSLAGQSWAYLSGDVEIHLMGIDLAENKLVYNLMYRGECGVRGQYWYFDLDGPAPLVPIHAVSLDPEPYNYADRVCPASWHQSPLRDRLYRRLTKLERVESYDVRLNLEVDSVEVDSAWSSGACYHGRLALDAAGRRGTVDLDMTCSTLIELRGLYAIPGRPELVALIAYQGRAFGCGQVAQPVVLPPGDPDPPSR